jgi:hypothetical protein
MKSFKEYLTESKKVYEFKVKLAGDYEKDASSAIKEALSRFKVESCSAGRRTPIQEAPVDFPYEKNSNVTMFDITLAYPATSVQVQSLLADKLGIPASKINVLNLHEQLEVAINHEHDKKSGESLLDKDYEASNHQDLVGSKHSMALLKQLSKSKHTLEQVKGVNDELLASSVPSEKPSKVSETKKTSSLVGSKSVKKPTAKTVKE